MLTPLLTASFASAAAAPEFLSEFCLHGTAAGGCRVPRSIGANPANGHLYVANLENNRIDEFTSWGTFVKAWGWGVAPGAVNEQQEVRFRATGGEFKLSFGAATTPDVEHDATPAEVESKLDALSTIGGVGGSVSVGEVPGNVAGDTFHVYVIAFKGALAGTDVAQLSATNGTIPLSGGSPSTELAVVTRANGSAGGSGLESCTAESGCQAGTSGAGAGQFTDSGQGGVAVDSAGDIYVVDRTNLRVEKFDPAGDFLLMFGKGVNSGSSGNANLCTNAGPPTDVCGEGSTGTGPGEFSTLPFVGSYITVGPGDKIYVGDESRIQRFASNGVVEAGGEIPLPGAGQTQGLAIDPSGADPAGELYVISQNVPNTVRRVNSSGTVTRTIEVLDEEGTLGVPQALATDSAGDLYLTAQVPISDVEKTTEILKYNAGGALESVFAKGEFPDESTGIVTNPYGDLYGVNSNMERSFVRAYGPAPGYEIPPPVPPEIDSQYIAAVGTTEAAVKAEINPHFWDDTTYYVQYGTHPCFEGGCQEQPLPPGISLGGGTVQQDIATNGVALSGLAPATTYHFRFVAQSGGGGPVFGLSGKLGAQAEGTLTTRKAPPAPPPPDGRVYEMVSPPQKAGGEVGAPSQASGTSAFSAIPKQASPDGEAITYASFTSFGDAEGAPSAVQYLSKRSAGGWSTENISPHFEEGYLRDPLVGFSSDLAHAAAVSLNPPLAPGAPPDTWNLYARDNSSGGYAAVTAVEPEVAAGQEYCVGYAGASASFDRVIFAAQNGALLAGDPLPTDRSVNLYEWTPSGGIVLASTLPGGVAATPQRGTSFGARYEFIAASSFCNMATAPLRHAISVDGSRMFWTYPAKIESPFLALGPVLFARLIGPGGPETVEVDAKQGGSASSGGGGAYQDATPEGSKVFFTDANKLTQGANGTDLYRYNVEKHEKGEPKPLSNLTSQAGEAADVQGVLGISEKGDYAYFAAKGVLTTTPNSEGESAVSGGPNIYAWHEGEADPRFIATVSDSNNWSPDPKSHTARVSPDGRSLAFRSTTSLTGYDNLDQATGTPVGEVFLYDFEDNELSCASCNPTGARPIGAATLPGSPSPYEQPRYLQSGGRLFFETEDALDSNDTNAKRDVYELERSGQGSCGAENPSFSDAANGCQFLISSGTSGDESFFLDASSDGRDAFIATRSALVAQLDKDTAFDVYDARIGGSPPPPAPAPCEGEGCRGEGSGTGPTSSPGTHNFEGPGNPKERTCKKRFVKKGGSCAHKKHHKRAHAKRRSDR